MAGMEDVIKQLSERALKEEHDRKVETMIKVLSTLYDKSAAYTNIIMAAGYAGFFTVWSNMKAYMSPAEMRVSAICMLVSLLVFVLWEVTKMILTSRNLHRLLEVLQSPQPEFDAKLKKQQHDERTFNIGFLRAWRIVLVSAIAPALLASATLIYSFITHL